MIIAMTQDEMFGIAALLFVAYLGIRAVYRRLTLSREERGILSLAGSQGMDRSQAQQWRKQRRHVMQRGSGLMKVQMKFCLLTLTILMTLGMTAREALAQQVLPSIKLHGVPLSCTAHGGKRVPLIISEEAIALGGGGFAQSNDANVKGPSLMLSPTYLNTFPRLAAFFLFYHECAHLALPMGVGLQKNRELQENNADCYGIEKMREHGLISSMKDFNEAVMIMKEMRGSANGHQPGPERVRRAAKCAKIPIVGSGDSFCRDLDKIFAGGKSFLERYDFDNNRIFSGLFPIGCYYDNGDGALRCPNDFAEEKRARSFANRLANKVRNCLPSDFEYEKSGSPGEWATTGHVWTNNATGHEISVNTLYTGEFDFTLNFPK